MTLGNLNLGGITPAVQAPQPGTSTAMTSPLLRAPAAAQPVARPGAATPQMHASGLPTQPPAGISPQLWSSVLQHLQTTNFGAQAQQRGAPTVGPSRAAPLPMTAQPMPATGQPFISR